MKPKTRREHRLRERFKMTEKWYGFVLERRIREERRMLKKTTTKHNRSLDKKAIDESIDLVDLDDDLL